MKQMISITRVLLFLTLLLSNNCERWYSATLLETDSSFMPIERKDDGTGFIQSNEQSFLPMVMRPDLRQSPKDGEWRFMKRKSNKDSTKPESIYTKDFENSTNKNKVKNEYMSLKPKKIRKRCPDACYRKSLRSNQTKTRFLEVFQVVKFDNLACTSSSGLDGTCLHEYECQYSGGTGMGSCADGYGTCCVTLLPCDSESSAAVGWFTNPDFPLPSGDRLSCSVALRKASEDVTQLRLDFSSFEMLPPAAGICQEDQFIVSGQNLNNVIPILCGINTGQHVYIEIGESEGPVYLSIQTVNPEKRLFSVKVTQLTSSDELAAPAGCLQYFRSSTGFMESFNYRDTSEIAIARSSSYLNNLNYAMCIERVPGSCSVTYTNKGYLQIVNYDTDGLPVIPPGQAGVEIFNCPSDWLLISATRLCGDRLNDGSVLQDFSLNAPVTDSSAGPIVVWFRSDEGYVGRGFRLQYEQISCTSS